MHKHARISLIALTVTAWAVLFVAVSPIGEGLDPDLVLLARTIAVTGAVAMLVVRTLPPVDEVLRIGKALGRAEAQLERESENVTPIRPELRVVGERERPTAE